MVQAEARTPRQKLVVSAANGRTHSIARGTIAFAAAFPSHLSVPTPRTGSPTVTTESRRRRAQIARRRWLRGEAATIMSVVSCFAFVCLLGIIYLAAYANVAAQGREVHNLQADVTAVEAQHGVLVAKFTYLSSGTRIQQEAKKAGMVNNSPSEYIVLAADVPGAARVTEVAMAH